mgnify:FL=1
MIGILIGLILVALLGLGGWLWLQNYRKQHALSYAQELVALKVLLPREQGAQEGERGPKDFKETMSIAEQFLTAFSSLYDSDPKRLLTGQETISLEFIVRNNLLSFYIVVPKHLRELAERQLHSYYPFAQIEPSQDFRIFGEQTYPVGAFITTKNSSSMPIRTYRTMESDPLNALTNSMSKLPQGMNAGFQVLLQPTSGEWRSKTTAAAKTISEGKSLAEGNWLTKGLGGLVGSFRTGSAEKKKDEPVRLTPIQEEMMKSIQEKGSKVGFETVIRLVVVSERSAQESKAALETIATALGQYTLPELNHLKRVAPADMARFAADYIIRRFEGPSAVLNTEELVSLYHFPNQYIDTPNIEWLAARTLPPPANLPGESEGSVILGKSVYRGEERMVRIQADDRRRHLYAMGKTGVGKTTLFTYQIEQDMLGGRGCCDIAPNGDAVEHILGLVPKSRAEDVIYFDPSDTDRPMGLNVLEWKRPEDKDFLVAEWLEIFYKLFDPNRTGMVGPQFEHWGRNASLSVMARPGGGTLIDIPRLFTDDAFREETVSYVTDPVVLSFWNEQMAKTADFHKSEMYNYFTSKFGRFMTNDIVRNIIGQKTSAFDFRDIMDSGKIFLVNLSKGKIGETNSYLLGMILVSKLQVAAFQRADTPEEQRKDFYLYVDEFQNFTTDTFKTILSEARKYRLNLNITNQYIAQLPEPIRDAVIGNAGTLVSFRIGAADAEFIAKEFPNITQQDLVNLTFANTYTKLLIDGTPSRPFSMRTIKSETQHHTELAEAIRQLSRLKYGKDRVTVEQESKRGQVASSTALPSVPPPAEGQ